MDGSKDVWHRIPERDVTGPRFFVSVFCTRTVGATALLSTKWALHTPIANPVLTRYTALNEIRLTKRNKPTDTDRTVYSSRTINGQWIVSMPIPCCTCTDYG
jgi:hypothetical protein